VHGDIVELEHSIRHWERRSRVACSKYIDGMNSRGRLMSREGRVPECGRGTGDVDLK
jgi:hypothetical protein